VAPCDFDDLSLADGNEEQIEIQNPAPGTYYITLLAFDAYSSVTLSVDLFTENDIPPTISNGGITLATQTPTIREISPNAIITVYGQDFVPDGVSALAPVVDAEGRVGTVLANTCLEIDGYRSPMFTVLSNQINAQASDMLAPGESSVVVVRGCDTENERRSDPATVTVGDVSPGFFSFIYYGNGVNPLAALHGGGPALLGPPGLIPGVTMTPGKPNEYASFFGTGFGLTEFPLAAGEIPGTKYPEVYGQARLVNSVQFRIGDYLVPAEDVFYAGSAPCCAGLQQFVVKISPLAPTGNLSVRATVAGRSTPAGPYVFVARQ
jgi:uncharacterized protein (TIGR03437 family)